MRYVLATIGVLAVAPCRAAEMPRFDVDGICAANQQAYGVPANQCIYLNQQAYEVLKDTWPTLSDWVQTNAIKQCRGIGPRPDYQSLIACVSGWAQKEDSNRQSDEIAGAKRFQP